MNDIILTCLLIYFHTFSLDEVFETSLVYLVGIVGAFAIFVLQQLIDVHSIEYSFRHLMQPPQRKVNQKWNSFRQI